MVLSIKRDSQVKSSIDCRSILTLISELSNHLVGSILSIKGGAVMSNGASNK